MALALKPHLQSIFDQLLVGPDQLVKHVSAVLEDTKDIGTTENRKNQWEFLIRASLFDLAATEDIALKDPHTTYYEQLCDKLDVALVYTELGACDNQFAFSVLAELLETQTVSSCSHIFSYIESRAARLTQDMVPQKGKALVFLRSLNDLLKRLSRTGSSTVFCGRILAFLSSVFPLGERSGHNLRGEYGPAWTPVHWPRPDSEEAESTAVAQTNGDEMEVDAPAESTPKRASEVSTKQEEFFNTFWSLQLPFSKPSLFTLPQTMPDFKKAVDTVLPVIKQANTTERSMMGSRAAAAPISMENTTSKLDSEEPTPSADEYFFAKFLTNPDLLDLEMADVHFRRQIVFQLLILLQHLLNFTKAAKAAWFTPYNRSLQMEFTLDPADALWIQDTIKTATKELENTQPHGKLFADTVTVILQREKNWVKWKSDMCKPDFVKDRWSADGPDGAKIGLVEATKDSREKMREPLEPWKWKMGSESLTNIWAMGYTGMDNLENPRPPGEVKDFVKKIKMDDARIEMRKKKLTIMAEAKAKARAKAAAEAEVATLPHKNESDAMAVDPPDASTPKLDVPTAPAKAASPAPITLPPDEQITELEEAKQRWSWLALRAARDNHLHHFIKIGTGDIVKLAEEIENQKRELEKPKLVPEERAISPAVHGDSTPKRDPESDIKTQDTSGEDIKMSDFQS